MERISDLREFLIFCAEEFEQIEDYKLGDRAISFAMERFPRNIDLDQIIVKTILIDLIYRAYFKHTHFKYTEIANHILQKKIDIKIQKGDLSVVDDIRYGHTNDLYSFATKYVYWHNPTQFPIFDDLIKFMLNSLNKRYKFHEEFTETSLANYSLLKSVLDSLISATQLKDFKYKKINQALLLCGKFAFKELPFNELPNETISRIQDKISLIS